MTHTRFVGHTGELGYNKTCGGQAELEAELKAKDKKIADQELTIDILKKATAIFVQNNRK